ncbi:MAG: hypothetical protein CM1200mP16_04480 [Nitrospina sp.]|nr:MAG: hypothetical protein CM1200mP16_04480 [Nitrospina sp.]
MNIFGQSMTLPMQLLDSDIEANVALIQGLNTVIPLVIRPKGF